MAAISYHISSLLEKMQSVDKDFRFMATNDLMLELQKDSIKLDDDSERKVVKMLLKLLEDKNGEVQNLAVKCLGPLVTKVKEYQVDTIVDCLCTNMVSDKEQLRDISSMGLKTVIGDLPPNSTVLAGNICRRITTRLTAAVAKEDAIQVQLEALDILGDLLSRFGNLLVTFHPTIQQALLPRLTSPRLAVRKRATVAIGYLVTTSNASLFKELMEFLLHELKAHRSTSTTRTYIQCIGSISRYGGHRLGEYMEDIIPLMMPFCSEKDEELGEYCLQAFEYFLVRCPREIAGFSKLIISVCLKFLVYDPNYNYDDDEDDDEDYEMELEDEEDNEDDEDYSDDDDLSWKVRRAAAKCLTALVPTRRDLLCELYTDVAPVLISRFKEREENVKSDIFTCFRTLLQQTRPAAVTMGALADPNTMDSDQNPVSLLQNLMKDLVKAVCRQLREKSLKTKQDCFRLLTELVLVLPHSLTSHVMAVLPGVNFALSDKSSSSNMKIETLNFLNTLLRTHEPATFHACIHIIVPPVVAAAGDTFYKIASEALVVIQQLVKVIRPLDSISGFKFEPFVASIYQCTLSRLKAADIDQEVKERAISCMSQVVYSLGDCLSTELGSCLPIFIERLRNEITRLTTVSGLAQIASSPLKINLRPYLSEAIPLLAGFLRKSDRNLKTHTLACLTVLVQGYPGSFTPAEVACVVKETPLLLTDAEVYIAQLTIALLTVLCQAHPAVIGDLCSPVSANCVRVPGSSSSVDTVVHQLLKMASSPLLLGSPLHSLIAFFSALCSTGTPGLTFPSLLEMLTEPIYTSTSKQAFQLTVGKQAFHSVAKCVARLVTDNPQEVNGVVRKCVSDLSRPASDAIHLFSLLAIGEIGREINLEGYEGIEQVFLNSFSSSNEEVKIAASYALGGVAVGNLPKFLPIVLREISDQPRRQYLLLHSLKEIISCESNQSITTTFKPYISTIWSMLMQHCTCPEEGIRNVVAECLGKLTLLEPETLLQVLRKNLTDPSPLARATVVTAVKFTITEQVIPIDPLLKACIGDFLGTLQDSDLNVRRVALVMFNSCAHNKPSLIRDLLPKLLPLLYNETKVRKELIREVEMGPFKHTVDDGLDLRKAGFECMYALLEQCLGRIDVFEFLQHMEDGLKDHYDVQMLTYLMLARVSLLCPSGVLQRMEHIIEPLKQTCLKKVKANSVKQEYEKQDELKRSALRAVYALLQIPDASKSTHLNDFMAQVRSTPDLYSALEAIRQDASASNTGGGSGDRIAPMVAPASMDTS